MNPQTVFVMLLLAVTPTVGAQERTPLRLTLKNAVDLAVKNNVGVLVAKTGVDEAAGTRERRFAQLLPHTLADALLSYQNRNLAVAGISIPGVPTVVPPYVFMDFRVGASQPLVDRQAYHDWKASVRAQDGATLTYQDVRDLVVRETAGLYLAGQTAAADVDAANARVRTSIALEQLARDQRGQGLATGIDVVRAQVQLTRDRQHVLVATNAYQNALLALGHFLGVDLSRPIELAESLRFEPTEMPNVADAVRRALAARADYLALTTERDALDEQRRAAAARALPRLSVSGDYGAIGRMSGPFPGIGEIQATVSIALFDRDRTGAQQEVASRLQRVNEQIADLARGIEQELRKAVLDLQSADAEIAVADAAVDLAMRELALAEDRFRNGVSDNIEVVAAQDAVAVTRDERTTALARHADARLALARALGASAQLFSATGSTP
jgi:outer membrane protein TolC